MYVINLLRIIFDRSTEGGRGETPLECEDSSVTPTLCSAVFILFMSKQRMIRDSFWTDSYIERLSPDEKLIFLYLLTNPLCNVAGIYEIRTKRIGFETGYDVEVIENILKRLERDKKILRHEDWIVMVNHIKNQSINPSVIQGCQRIFDELPQAVHRVVTGWVQAGLLNLTLLNLTTPNLTTPNVNVVTDEVEIIDVNIKSQKEKYGQFSNVLLEPVEYLKLTDQYGEAATQALIEELGSYMASTGKKYKSHYATLLNWARRKIQEHTTKNRNLNTPKLTADFSK